ncbi:hypothetical protein [Pedobacter sp. FW305-3-2-15-E-R2A2]|uniref:hypothetical protein n=1 Tax=Pedobacter sp. FW305-3-2-15-E-R2A2 TaxID=3140251 RepID=UPI0031401BA6
MRFYLNELSLNNLPVDEIQLEEKICLFMMNCIRLKDIGFTEMRSTIYPLDVQIGLDLTLGSWAKKRETGNRELKSRFKSLSLNAPLFHSTDENDIMEKAEWCNFSFKTIKSEGLGAAHLLSSVVVSFQTHEDWKDSEIHNVLYEYLEEDGTGMHLVSVRNVSSDEHIKDHKSYAESRLSSKSVPDDWKPWESHLPNVESSKEMLGISEFYEKFTGLSEREKLAEARTMGKRVAVLNHYRFDKELSRLNTDSKHKRDIYVSNNKQGRKWYLSVDVEKGAFEVCDHNGAHTKEILFNGKKNGEQKSDHSIKLKA